MVALLAEIVRLMPGWDMSILATFVLYHDKRSRLSLNDIANKAGFVQEVKQEDLHQWLLGKRKEGYAILGLEQTSEAVPLPDYKFEKKTIMLLGGEREGIPPDLLNLLDHALVIPQLGVIRSLNAHVSASIALYEYTRHFR